jgi:hypothetical protein
VASPWSESTARAQGVSGTSPSEVAR